MKRYIPLFALILVSLFSSLSLMHGLEKNYFFGMHFFMGFFLCQFAMLKLFDLPGFVEGFKKYDILAKKSSAYAYVYPFLELLLGLLYFSFIYQLFTYCLTVFLMSFGAIGVIIALNKGLDVRCACMGTALNVPLSTVTLSEDILMGTMACAMLFASGF